MINKKKILNIIFCLISLYVFIFISEMDWAWTIGICFMPVIEIIISVRYILCNIKNDK